MTDQELDERIEKAEDRVLHYTREMREARDIFYQAEEDLENAQADLEWLLEEVVDDD